MIRTIAVIGFLSLAFAFSANAHDADRIGQLEREVHELKARLSKLESMLSKQTDAQELVLSGDGWKSVANWRKLSTDMSTSDVREILGEPERIEGGDVAWWHYPSAGRVVFISGKVKQWVEPRR